MANYKLNDTVTLPKGLSIGMGTLKHDIQGTVIGLDTDTNGKPIYTIEYKSSNSVISTTRYTTVSEDELPTPVVETPVSEGAASLKDFDDEIDETQPNLPKDADYTTYLKHKLNTARAELQAVKAERDALRAERDEEKTKASMLGIGMEQLIIVVDKLLKVDSVDNQLRHEAELAQNYYRIALINRASENRALRGEAQSHE